MQIEITDKDIEYAEAVLLPNNCSFDNERRKFIKDLSTLDLQAVPGSGKTTALLAKLLILSRKTCIEKNSGILVISHTNAAIDEIKERLSNYSPQLFEYPNFVGTIQSFVDTFLAIPFYTSLYRNPPKRIDDEIVYERCNSLLQVNNRLTHWIKNQNNPVQLLFSLKLDEDNNFSQHINNLSNTSPTYELLGKFKQITFRDGFLKFSEAYDLAFKYINSIPEICNILQNRFKYIFVDEMQDMDQIQFALLEKCFFTSNKNICFQRIGDINQSIFSYDDSNMSFWNHRKKTLTINGSQRLTPEIASLVQHFSLVHQEIKGFMRNNDGTPINLKPYLFVFEKQNINKVIPKYIELIKMLKENNILKNIVNEKYSVIGWRKSDSSSLDSCNINSYWPPFIKEDIKLKNDYESLYDYLLKFDKTTGSLESIRKNVLNSIVKIFRIEGVRDEREQFYTKRKIIDFLRQNKAKEYEDFKLLLYTICKHCINEEYTIAHSKLKLYLPGFMNIFGIAIKKSKSFIEQQYVESRPQQQCKKMNTIIIDDIRVDIQTIHAIKGKTVTGVLYLDTFNGYKCQFAPCKYESGKLANYFLGEYISDYQEEERYIKQAAKMVYVGFSRPTHLLCYAIEKSRFDQYLQSIDQTIWNILKV